MSHTHLTDDRAWLEYRAQSIGRCALEALSEDQEASIMGVTSRGLFVRTAGRWITFISFEAYRGPCTIALGQAIDPARAVKTGAPAQVVGGRLILPSAGITISANPGTLWHPPIPSGAVRSFAGQLADLKYLARVAVTSNKGQGLGALLPALLGLKAGNAVSSGEEMALADVSSLRQALADRDASRAAGIIESLLGKGGGLTPAWDDFVVGLLLLLNRRRAATWPDGDLPRLNRRAVEAAYERTTRLSANLIECAALGESDERLVNAVDCILTGSPPASECLPHLLAWGNSSGVDALVGMAVAVVVG